jgi:two-component system, chemotaxis family, response regulator Rcp1
MNRIPQVLLVDRNPADTDLASDILARCAGPSEVRVVADGEPARAFRHRLGNYANQVSPDLVIPDLNLPRKDGRAVLAEVKADPWLRPTPVVRCSTTRAGLDVVGSYELGADSYLGKPGNRHDLVSAAQSISAFWFGCADLLRKEDK